MKPDDAKQLYSQYYNRKYKEFVLEKDDNHRTLSLAKKGWGWLALTTSRDTYSKFAIPYTDDKIIAIKKNSKFHGFLWKTSPEQLKKGVRWGIIPAESITGQVIAILGRYRMVAHKRVAKGMVSNMQALKLTLLDVYQDRMEALQALESLVNMGASKQDYKKSFADYLQKLYEIKQNLKTRFSPLQLKALHFPALLTRLETDIDKDIGVATDWLQSLNLPLANRARGNHSILEFVKQQMHGQLYAFQGLNQDAVFSIGALTRGELNDCIEDARKCIDDHEADLRNAVTAGHHVDYSQTGDKQIVYDFASEYLSAEEQASKLLAISFIEGWDSCDYTSDWNRPTVSNREATADLTKISATKWHTHRNKAAYFWQYIKNWFNGLLFESPLLDEGVNDRFFLFSSTLIRFIKLKDPLWKKVLHYAIYSGSRIKEVFVGIYNFGRDFILGFPRKLIEDFLASRKLPGLSETLKKGDSDIGQIHAIEDARLDKLLRQTGRVVENNATLLREAKPDYPLTAGESHDILTAVTRAVDLFFGHFTHQIYTKDPVGAALFTTAFAAGGLCVLFPTLSKTLFLDSYVKGFGAFAKLVGSSPLSEAVCGGLMQAEGAHLLWNAALEGPESHIMQIAHNFLDNPLPNALAFAAAYGLGYALANLPIPHFHEFMQEEIGSSDILNYPVIGIKFGLGVMMIILADEDKAYKSLEILYDGNELSRIKLTDLNMEVMAEMQKMSLAAQQFRLVQWLNANTASLQKLNKSTQFEITRQIDYLFIEEQAISLKKLVDPEKNRSIAYQFLAVPLGYIPAMARVIVSIFASFAAWLTEKPYPRMPMARAFDALRRKFMKDMSRLVNITSNLLTTMVSLLATPLKLVTSLSTLLIGRFAAFFDKHPGHFLYSGLSLLHQLYRELSALIYPVRTMKANVFANPLHTMNEVVSTYEKVLKGMGQRELEIFVENCKGKEKDALEAIISADTPDSLLIIEEEPAGISCKYL